MKSNKKFSFTLAEVLITLVVIGVIASITVPTMMANHRKHEIATRVKKFYSMLLNAIKLAEAEQGIPSSDWDYDQSHEDFFHQYLAKYINTSKEEVGSRGENNVNNMWQYSIHLDDGTVMGLDCGGHNTDFMCFYIDANGDKKPNEHGRDIFEFDLYKYTYLKRYKNLLPLDPWKCHVARDADCTREQAVRKCKNEPDQGFCTQLLIMDGCEFKNDYPLRI